MTSMRCFRTGLFVSTFLLLTGSLPAQTTDSTKGGPLDLGKMWTFDNHQLLFFKKLTISPPTRNGLKKRGWRPYDLRIIAPLRSCQPMAWS